MALTSAQRQARHRLKLRRSGKRTVLLELSATDLRILDALCKRDQLGRGEVVSLLLKSARPKRPDARHYVIPVSGGKDSQACVAIATRDHAPEDVSFVFQDTSFDHEATYTHLAYMERRYGIKIEHCKNKNFPRGVFDLIEKAGYFPNTVARNCTKMLKQVAFRDWLIERFAGTDGVIAPGTVHVYLGVRADESRARSKKYGNLDGDDTIYLPDMSDVYGHALRHVTVSFPIVDWTYERVMKFLADRGDEVNPLYAKGHTRVGCYPCLLSRTDDWILAAKDPQGSEHIRRLLNLEEKFADGGSFRKDGAPRKLVKIHATRDVRKIYQEGLRKRGVTTGEDDGTTCDWCAV